MTAVIKNPMGAFGEGFDTSRASIVQSVLVNQFTPRGSVVAQGATASGLIVAQTTTPHTLQVGVAVEDIPANTCGMICILGYCDYVLKDATALAAGALLTRSGTVNGAVTTLTAAAGTQGQAIGVVLLAQLAGDPACTAFISKF